jgi:hypothetical protein
MQKILNNDRYTGSQQYVTLLIHGLWMTGLEMSLMALRLRRLGLNTCRFHYASRKASLETNIRSLVEFTCNIEADGVNFVCHSLGGIILCHMLHKHANSLTCRPCRVVLLGSPVNGSVVARKAAKWKMAQFAVGESLQALVSGCPSCCRTVETGMIAGTVNVGMGMFFLNGHLPADGLVALEDTRADWIREHAMVRTTHMGLLFSAKAAKLAYNFLKTGTFATIDDNVPGKAGDI